MVHPRKSVALATLMAALVSAASVHAQSQPYPNHPVTIVVPFAPGGPNDVIARVAGNDLSKTWKQPVVVENRAGAGGVVGATYVSQREPDGYTLLISTNVLTFPILAKGLSIKPREDLVPVTIVAGGPLVLASSTKLGAKTIADVVAKAKANPGKLNAGVIASTLSQLDAVYLFKKILGIDVAAIPYNSTAQTLQALLAGENDMNFTIVQAIRGPVEAGKVIPIAVAGEKRDPRLPSVPTFRELGIPYETGFWLGFYGPKGLQQDLTNRIAADFAKTFSAPEVKDAVEKAGMSVMLAGPAAMRRTMDEEEKRYLEAAQLVEAK